MPTPTRPNVPYVRVSLYMNEDVKEASNIYWFDPGNTYTIDPTQIASDSHDLVLALHTNVKVCMASTVTLRGGYVEWSDGVGTIGIDSYQPIAGTISAAALPEDVAAVVSKWDGGTGPSHRGRWYFSGIPETFSTGSYLNVATGKVALDNLASNLLGTLSIGANMLVPSHFGKKGRTFQHLVLTNPVDLLGTRRRRRGPF